MRKNEKLQVLYNILLKRESIYAEIVLKIKEISELNREIREGIVDELSIELTGKGFRSDWEPNDYGLLIEDLIDFCELYKDD